jgi:tRNA threonylcarbamoyladenosine biosynthesis protein TsaE
MKISVDSIESMYKLGAKIGAQLKAGDVVVLTGELGSGKTSLTKGIAKVFGISDVSSPTFMISRIHKANPNFIHVDAYRLLGQDPINFTDLDFESYLDNSIFVIEWGKDFVEMLTDQYLEIKIEPGEGDSSRIIDFISLGERWAGFKV